MPARTRSRALPVATLGALAALAALAPRAARAQDTTAAPIQDNSFLVEEAYNQEARVVQHVGTFQRSRVAGDWAFSFTQELPLRVQRHQFSYTIPVLPGGVGGAHGRVGDVALTYRAQLSGIGGGRTAFAPRLTALLPTGSARDGTGAGGAGVQANLPLSVQLSGRLVTHLNAGATLTPRARDAAGATARTTAYNAGHSLVWLAAPRFNALVETSWTRAQSVAGPGVTAAETQLFVSPGVRWAHDFASGLQVVPGVAVPIGVGPSRGSESVFLYLSFEHAF